MNGRYRGRQITGVERYAEEVSRRFRMTPRFITPRTCLKGMKGHVWEQAMLPFRTAGHLLWSPCNTGPVLVEHQVVTLHDVIALDRPEWFHPKFVRLYREILPRLLARVRHVLTGSAYSKQRIIERFGLKPEKISVTPYGVSEEFRPRSAAEVDSIRRMYNIPDHPYVLMLSSREPRKNHNGVMKAWPAVMKRLGDVSLVVAGGHGTSQNFRPLAVPQDVKNVIFTDYVPTGHLPALYSGASAFVFPSLYEGFGLPVLEALACGTPAVTSNSTSLPELQGGKMILVDPLSSDEIASAIMNLLEDQSRRELVIESCEKHARQFSWERTAHQTEEILLQHA